ncbi:MAG: asparagine--tRNA ligase [Candidatus Aenigmatarchaeota archaeon]
MFAEISEIIKGREGKFSIRGWLHHKRSSGGILFWLVRDGSGIIQCTLRKNLMKDFEELEKLPVESVVEIYGTSKRDKRAPYGYELVVESVKVLHKAKEDYPIAKKYHGPDFLLDHRHLYLRSRKMQLILTIRSRVIQLIREWFISHGYKEFQSPIFTAAAVEGGATLFPVKYFDRTVYLTQSWQLYAEAAIASLGKIFTIAPSFRAEKSRTRRHLTEYWHVEAELPFCDLEGLMKEEEELISFICQKVALEFEKELKELGRDPQDLLKVKPPFPRITYKEAIEILQKSKVKVKYGDDLGADEEKVLASKFDIPFFVMYFPKGIKAFYHKPHPKDKSITLSVDLLAPEGIGEITGGGQRCDGYEELLERIEEEKLKVEDYKWYLDLRKYGSVVHSGFGLGLERLLMWILKLDHIRDAIPFPRLINRVYP